MTKIKLCGMMRPCDIEWANSCSPDYIGFIFAKKSRRYVSPETAAEFKGMLKPGIKAVGVFVEEDPAVVANLLEKGIIDIAQLHGKEDEEYIKSLKKKTDKPVFKAFRIDGPDDVAKANASCADMVLLDSGDGGTGRVFDWKLLKDIKRPYFLAGGLAPENIEEALRVLKPFGVDVSSGIETDGFKDQAKMADFTAKVRKEDAL